MRADGESESRRKFVRTTAPAAAAIISGDMVSATRSRPPGDAEPRIVADAFGDRFAIRGRCRDIGPDALNGGPVDPVTSDPVAALERTT